MAMGCSVSVVSIDCLPLCVRLSTRLMTAVFVLLVLMLLLSNAVVAAVVVVVVPLSDNVVSLINDVFDNDLHLFNDIFDIDRRLGTGGFIVPEHPFIWLPIPVGPLSCCLLCFVMNEGRKTVVMYNVYKHCSK